MRNTRTAIWATAVVVSLAGSPTAAMIEFKDGRIHNIDYHIHDDVAVDHWAPGMQTTVNILDGASTAIGIDLRGYENSRINILGGTIDAYLRAYDRG